MSKKEKKIKLNDVSKDVKKESKTFWKEFAKFATKGNIIDMAVAVVVGTAFNKLVSSLVSCIITPLTSMLIPTKDLSTLKWVLVPGVEADADAGIAAVAEVAVTYGQFLQNIIDFFIIALSIFVVLKVFMKVKESFNRKEKEAAAALARAEEERKKAEAAAEEERKQAEAAAMAERQAQIRREFLENVTVQADVLNEIRDIMVRMEKQQSAK